MLKNALTLAWYLFQQEKYASHQVLLRWTQGILLVFIITLSLTSANIQHFLEQNLQSLLGADVVLSHSQPFTPAQLQQLNVLAKDVVHTRQLKAMLTNNEQWQQVLLKAVDMDYPLQGEIQATQRFDEEHSDKPGSGRISVPESGSIWLEPRLMTVLGVKVGDTLQLGNHSFHVSRILLHEPDRLMESHNVEMRAMMNVKDLPSLHFPEEVIQHRYLIAADQNNIEKILTWQAENAPAAKVHHKRGGHPLALFWIRAENFMGLASIILFFMAAIGIEQLSHVHVRKDQFFSALCMSMTASKSMGLMVSWFKWIFGFLWMLPVVLLFSAGLHWLTIKWLGNTFNGIEWVWDVKAPFSSIAIVAVVFMLFHSRVWLALLKCSPAQLLKGEHSTKRQWKSQLTALLGLCVITLLYSDNYTLTLMVVLATLFSVVVLIAISWASLYLLERLTRSVSGLIPFTLFMMRQRIVSKSTQILGIGLCCFLLLFTLMLLKDFGASMGNYTRQHDGNVLITQATKTQMNFINQWAEQKQIALRQQKPFIYAKLLEVNATPLLDFIGRPSESAATLARPIRLHWSDNIPANNRIVDGKWWQPDTAHWQQISVEKEVMVDLKLSLGDQLTFFIGSKSVTFTIVATHEYQSGKGVITFWMQIPSAALQQLDAAEYSMASMELAEKDWAQLSELWRHHPSLRMVSLKELMLRFDNVLGMVTKVVSGFSFIIILLAAIVIMATVKAAETKDKKKNSIILSFGLSRSTCFRLTVFEWLITASIAAIGAILGTYLAGLLIYQSQFSMPYYPDMYWLVGTLFIILTSVTIIGLVASRKSLNSSVRQLMSES
ncbi:ABC transporter permease [Alteromonas sp. ASW11-130]|uniref:ABC transporter permease n=1 Tax=Alteromonas sp. ASW11-130 TaxID=3015775 RepID=UPI002241D6D2|nr:FtsX-like permease family protein [Alteromonas sp. ASW11-130]MCW8093313.1 permease [Alteromonas sp. ASW11-130]